MMEVGSKVRIKNINGVPADEDTIKLVQEIHIIQEMIPMPLNDRMGYAIYLEDVPYSFTQDDVEEI